MPLRGGLWFSARMIKFTKMHGLGNDFVILDGRQTSLALSAGQISKIADRRRGVGCDQLIVIEKQQDRKAFAFIRFYNSDGSESGACGNGTRCVADLLLKEAGTDEVVLETTPGLLVCKRAENGLVQVNMGAPRLNADDIPLAQECDTLHLPLEGDPVAVNMGNPHCVFFIAASDAQARYGVLDDWPDNTVKEWGSKIEHDPLFPERTNVEFVHVIDETRLRMRVWERGAGITQACGTGACASAVAAIRRGLTGRKVTVTLDGGDLTIEWPEDGDVLMTGPVAYVFDGSLAL